MNIDPWVVAFATTSILTALFSVIARIGRMHQGVTRIKVFLQHLALGVGLLSALFLPPHYGLLALALGVQIFLSLGSHRWRHGAPLDTEKAKWISN